MKQRKRIWTQSAADKVQDGTKLFGSAKWNSWWLQVRQRERDEERRGERWGHRVRDRVLGSLS